MTTTYAPAINSAPAGEILSGWSAVYGTGVWTVGDYSPTSGNTQSFGLASPVNHSIAVATGVAVQLDMDFYAEQVLPAVGAGVPTIGMLARVDATGANGYLVLFVPTATAISVHLYRMVNSISTSLGSATYTPASYAAGMAFSARLAVYGDTISAKAWDKGAAEPSAWTVSYTDTTAPITAPGHIGLYMSGTGTTAMGVDGITLLDTVTGVVPTITITTPAAANTQGGSPISGTYTGYAPTSLPGTLDGSTAQTITELTIPSIGTWSAIAGSMAAGSHTLSVSYGQTPSVVSAASGSFTAVAGGLSVNTPAGGLTQGAAYQLQGALSAGVMPANIGYAYDGGAAVAATSPQISGNTISVTAVAPVQGSHVVQLVNMDAPTMISAQSAQFTVGAAVVPAALVIDAIQVAAVSSIIDIAIAASGTPAADGTFNYGIDGSGLVAAASPVLVAGKWVFAIVAPATAGIHTLVVQQGNSASTTATVTFTTVATQTIAPNNAAILYSPANWDVEANAAISINAGAYFDIFFGGSYAALNFDVSLMGSPASEIEYQVDGYETQAPWITAPVSPSIVIKLPPDTAALPYHLLRVRIKSTSQLINRWNPAAVGTAVKFTGLTIVSGASVVPCIPPAKNIVILGDSIPEGVRAVNYTAANDTDQNSSAMSWSSLRSAGMGVGVVAFGSQGFDKSGAGSVPGIEQTYNYLYSGKPRSYAGIDAALFMEGANNSETDPSLVTAAATTLCNGLIASVDPGCVIIAARPFNGTAWAAVQAGIAACSDPGRIIQIDTTGIFNAAYGADNLSLHPSGPNHLSQIAPQMMSLLLPILFPSGASVRPPWFRAMLAA